MTLRTIDDLDIVRKRVLLRVDFNVPLEHGEITDETRIEAALPTIRALLERDAIVIACSHLGRPKGQRMPELSLQPVAEKLSELLDKPVAFSSDVIGSKAEEMVQGLGPGEVGLLENLRFDPGEESNDPAFAEQLAELADVYVNDAFGAAHRAHASTEGVAHLLPSAAGLLMEKEVAALTKVLERPRQPVVLILGGAKVSDKIDVITSFIGRAESILIGGGMANTFLLAKGLEIGNSLAEPDVVGQATELMEQAKTENVDLRLPVDAVIARGPDDGENATTVSADQVPSDQSIFDIGPDCVQDFASSIAGAGTIVWNGPMGMFEREPFDAGTTAIAKLVADADGFSLVGGGDSVAAIVEAGLDDDIDHVSTGGGASLEFLEGKQLPGIAVLSEGD